MKRLEQSRSQRILWLLEELNVPYELEIFHRDPKTHLAPPELKKVHALGKSPVLSVTPPGSTEAVVIAESANIVEYLLEHWGKDSTLLPKRYKEGQDGKIGGETEEWLRYRYFMHYAEGSMMTLMLLAIVSRGKLNQLNTFRIAILTNFRYQRGTSSILPQIHHQLHCWQDQRWLPGPQLQNAFRIFGITNILFWWRISMW